MSDITVQVQPTPNPNALKFIISKIIKSEGKSSFKSPTECEDIELARELFDLRGVDQLHFFQNVITVNKFNFEEWDDLEPKVIKLLQDHTPNHDPNFVDFDPVAHRKSMMNNEELAIDAIIDKHIRPGLQGDGGDLEIVSYQNNVLLIKYQGACGTCPSSTMGTLEAIRGILRDEYSQDIEVYIAP
jgi:Fe-S cluster biogenesis protein NfuA